MPAFIVAEAGVNHLGDRAKMLAFCDAAKACGASAAKFQAYDAGALARRRGLLTEQQLLNYWDRGVPHESDTFALLEKAELSDADLDAIAAHCKSISFKWFASVFDPSQVERVLSRGACALKIGHKEASREDLLIEANSQAFKRKVPCYASGTASHGLHQIQWIRCVAEYPATSPPKLGMILPEIWDKWDGPRGFSSHYTDYRIPAAAALRGAEYIEAHLKLSDQDPEAAWSLSVEDFGKMVKLAREYESWL